MHLMIPNICIHLHSQMGVSIYIPNGVLIRIIWYDVQMPSLAHPN